MRRLIQRTEESMSESAKHHHHPSIVIPRPDRIRNISSAPFAWLEARLARDHWLSLMSPQAIAAYTFLCLAANQQGLSWYRRDKIRAALELGEDELSTALARLYALDLVAYQPFHQNASEGFHQVLSLPQGGPSKPRPSAQLLALIDSIGK
jgi:hypothetical protein